MKLFKYLIFMSLLFTFSCDDDCDECDDNPVVVDLVVDMYANPDNSGQVQCLPVEYGDVFFPIGGWIGGETNLNEEISSDDSYMSNYDCVFGPGEGQTTNKSNGKIVFKSGDLYYWESVVTLTFADFSFVGNVTIDGGTGKYLNALGFLSMEGTLDPDTGRLEWTGEGKISY